ncbi:MFS transporter [Rugosimonospora africana]|uniref:MFS transporter n=1 Tax=Rugosimonospora africana TaxID=556532 RepID=A0A8J3QSS5_9ACTN|nr:MFS transporter [Rugosimonospora africana]GIH15796.1 MFS transporter [Rugosimonospora africana]
MTAATLDTADLSRFRRRLTLLSSIGMFLDGFDLTVIAVALPVLKKSWTFTSFTLGVTSCSAIVGMFVGALVFGRVADRVGRKKMYLIDLIGFVVFAALAAFSADVWELILFRFLLGLCIGADYPISSSLTAEFGSPRDRGRLVVVLSLMWNVGALAAYLVGVAFLPIGTSGWRWMLLVGAALALVTLVFRASIPESPRWLIAHGRADEARRIVADLVNREAPGSRLAAADVVLPDPDRPVGQFAGGQPATGQPATGTGQWRRLFSRGLISATFFVCVFWFAHDVAYYGIQMYSPTILTSLGGSTQLAADIGSAIIAALGVVGAVIAVLFVDSWGRRPVLLTAFAGETAVLVALALAHAPALALIVVLFAIAILFSNMGPGTLDMVYCTELFPTDLRAAGTGLGTAVSRIGAILGVLVFPDLVSAWGVTGALWLFVAAGVLGLVTTAVLAPETKNRTLEQTIGTRRHRDGGSAPVPGPRSDLTTVTTDGQREYR